VSPIAGTVTQLNIAVGETADPAKTAVEIVDLDRLVASVDVPAAELAQLRAGQEAAIDLRSGDSTTQPADNSTTRPAGIVGNVVLVDPAVNPATGMGSVDIALPAGSGLSPGEFVRAKITIGEETDRLTVPTRSITQDQYGEPAVGKLVESGRWAMLIAVKTGWRDGDKVEISGEGLDAGTQIVTTGANGLIQRTRVNQLKD
jgi:RND family efflux transporter MFP subunit